MSICRHYENEEYKDATNAAMTDEDSLSNSDPISIDLDQETIINTSQVEDSDMNPNDPCVITHLDDTHPVVYDQSLSDLECDISNTSDNPAMNMDGKMKVTFSVREYGSINSSNNISDKITNIDNATRSSLDHPRNILQNKSTGNDVASILQNQKAEQHNSTSTDLTKQNALCCKMSIIFVMFCIITCSLMPIVLYYVSQLEGKERTVLEYSNDRNISNAKV